MRGISVITAPAIVDRMLRHVQSRAGADEFAARAPPAA